MVFHRSLSDSKSPEISRTLLSILAVLSYVIVWMVSTRPLISKFSIPFNNYLVTVPKALIANGIIVTFMFHNLFNSLARWWWLIIIIINNNNKWLSLKITSRLSDITRYLLRNWGKERFKKHGYWPNCSYLES